MLELGADGLKIDGHDAAALVARFGSPLHVISAARLRANARALVAALESAWSHGPTAVLASLKANPSPTIRRLLGAEGLGCDVFGSHELTVALACGVEPALVSLNGATKAEPELALAVAHGVRIAVDSLAELERLAAVATAAGRTAAVRLRLRPWLDDAGTLSDFSAAEIPARDAVQRYRAGIPDDEWLACLELAHRHPALELRGLMAHASRQTTALEFWAAFGRFMAGAVATARDHLGVTVSEVDLGGGLAGGGDPTGRHHPRRRAAAPAPAPGVLIGAIVGAFSDELARRDVDPTGMQLEIEPGRALLGSAGIHLATVLHVKRQTMPVAATWLETDTSEAFLPDVVWEAARFPIVVASPHDPEPVSEVIVTGRSCGFDELDEGVTLPQLEPGSLIAFLDTGAYQDATSNNFNLLGRPATVLIDGDDAAVITRRETFADVMARHADWEPG
ncbi:MAG: alanine racemase [Gaiellales bacterium]